MDGQRTSQTEPRSLGVLLRRGWPAIVVAAVLGLAGGGLLTYVEKKQYVADASVLVTPTGAEEQATLANSRTTGSINLDTEARLVKSADVASQVRKLDPSTRSVGLAQLLRDVTVSVPANTQILNVQYAASSPAVAAQRANDFASAYLIQRQADAQATLNAQIKNTEAELTSATTQLKSVATTLSRLPANSGTRNFVQAERALVIGQISELTSIRTKLLTTAVTPGKLVTKAKAPTAPVKPSVTLNLASGLALGLLIGLIAAGLRSTVSRRLRTPGDVAGKLHLPVLATIPPTGGPTAEPNSSARESYRRLSNVLVASVTDLGMVVVTGVGTPRAVAAVTRYLSEALSDSGVAARAALAPGSAAAAKGELSHGVEVPATSVRNRSHVDAIRDESLLIVCAADGAESADAQALGLISDAVVVVVEARSNLAENSRLLRELDAVGAPLLGAVLVPNGRWWRRSDADEVEGDDIADLDAGPDVEPAPVPAESRPANRAASEH